MYRYTLMNGWMDGWMDYIDRLAILDILDIIWCIRYYMCTWLQFTKQRKSNSCPFGCQLLHESSHIWKDCSKTSDMIMNLGTIHQESPELFTNHKSDKHITHRYRNTSQMNHICITSSTKASNIYPHAVHSCLAHLSSGLGSRWLPRWESSARLPGMATARAAPVYCPWTPCGCGYPRRN